MANFCTNCGAKLRKEDNFCTNCGTKVDTSYAEQNNYLKSSPNTIEKDQAKKELKRIMGGILSPNKNFGNEIVRNGLDFVNDGKAIKKQVEKEIESGQIKSGGVEFRVNQLIHEYKIKKEKEKARIAKEKEEENKKLKAIDEIFESAEIRSEIRKNNIDQIHVNSIKDSLKNKIINEKENMAETEIKYFIKTELEKIRIAKEEERIRKEIEKNKMAHGGYCSIHCRHYYEEFFDDRGAILGDFDSGGYVEYSCLLGHTLVNGRFCKDYE